MQMARRCATCHPRTGGDYGHRREWIARRLRHLAAGFAIDVFAYAVLENHLHVVPRARPDLAANWSDEEIAKRWWHVCPLRKNEHGEPASHPRQVELKAWLADAQQVRELRSRLCNVSWFMRLLKEPIARRANREDHVNGHFWATRFDCNPLLDPTAILACCIYVDLNAIRAGMAETPEQSTYTSAHDRIQGRQLRRAGSHRRQNEPDVWLPPIGLECESHIEARDGRCASRPNLFGAPRVSDQGFLPMTLDEYLTLLDFSGREIRRDKRGSIPDELAPILDRLEINAEKWVDIVVDYPRWFRRVVGRPDNMRRYAHSEGRQWLHGISASTRVFQQ